MTSWKKGSHGTHTLLIVGLAATVHPLDVAQLSVAYTTPIMLFFSIALLYFVKTDWRISRTPGVCAALGCESFLTAAFFQGWG